MQQITRSVHLKLDVSPAQKPELDSLFESYGQAIIYLVQHFKTEFDSFVKLDEPKSKKCDECGTEERPAEYHNKETNSNLCFFCFKKKWDWSKPYKQHLDFVRNAFPKLSKHSGYYSGVVKLASQMFSSYRKKLLEREYEIEYLTEQLLSETDAQKQLKLRKKLEDKQKGIKQMQFKKNIIYLGTLGMFELKKTDGKYWVGINSHKQLRTKEWYELRLGERDSYVTEHNKYKIVDEAIEKKERPCCKLIKRDTFYEFMFAKKSISTSLDTNAEIEKYFKEHQETSVIVTTFNVKQPLRCTVFQNGKIVCIKKIGNKSVWHWIQHERQYRSKMAKIFAERYTSKWKRHKAKKAFFKRRGKFELKFIKYNIHKLTKDYVKFISSKYPNSIVVMQDVKGIKRFSYPRMYQTVLSRWNVSMQKTMLDYKERLKNFNIYYIKFKDSKNLVCSRCGEEIKEKKKVKNMLTIKLDHALDRRRYYKTRIIQLLNKLEHMKKYAYEGKMKQHVLSTEHELELVKQKADELSEKPTYHFIECKCGKTEFHINEAFNLYNRLCSSARKDTVKSSS